MRHKVAVDAAFQFFATVRALAIQPDISGARIIGLNAVRLFEVVRHLPCGFY